MSLLWSLFGREERRSGSLRIYPQYGLIFLPVSKTAKQRREEKHASPFTTNIFFCQDEIGNIISHFSLDRIGNITSHYPRLFHFFSFRSPFQEV